MKVGYIYTITNLTNNLIYIGKTQSLYIRLRGHLNKLQKGNHNNKHLQDAWNKYGEENFKFEVLEEYPVEYLYAMEHYWCNLLQTHNRYYGYNIQPTHPNNNYTFASETKDIIRKKATGRKWSDEYKELFRQKQLGRKHSIERRFKAAIGNYKPILQYDLNNNFIKEWESLKSAGESFNRTSNNIGECCRGKLKTSSGFVWKFKEVRA